MPRAIPAWGWSAGPTAVGSNWSRRPPTAGSTPSCPPSPGTPWSPAWARPTRSRSGWSNILANLVRSDHVDPQVRRRAGQRQPHRHDHPGRAAVVRGPGPGRPGGPHPHPDPHRPGHRRHAVHPAGGSGELRDPAKNHVPTAMLWFCGGHGVCLTPPGNQQLPVTATIAWLNRYVKRRHVGQHRTWVPVRRPERHQLLGHVAGRSPRCTGDRRRAGDPGLWWPAVAPGRPTPRAAHGQLAGLVGPITPAQAANAVERRHLLREPVGRGGGRPPAAAHLPRDVAAGAPADPGLRPTGRRVDRPGPRQPDHPDRRHPRRPHPHHLGPAGDGGVHRRAPRPRSSSSSWPPPWPTRRPGSAGASTSPTSTSRLPVASDITVPR